MIRTAQATAYIPTERPTALFGSDGRLLAIIPADSPLDADLLAELLNAVEEYRGAFYDKDLRAAMAVEQHLRRTALGGVDRG